MYNGAYNDNSPVNHKKIARIMRRFAWVATPKNSRSPQPGVGHIACCLPTWSKRNFTAPAADKVLVDDFTYLPIVDGSNM